MARALVTGATSGIGRAIALALKAAGHEVTAAGRSAQALAELSDEGLEPLALDLGDSGAIAALSARPFDILVNNAGAAPPLAPFCDQTIADIEGAVALNLTAALAVTHAVAPGMRARGSGHIFFTGSVAGHAPFANLAVYGAAKAAIGAFAQTLRLELSPHRVRVTEIVAGRVETGFYRGLVSEETRAAMYAGGATLQPEDVAAMVLAVLNMPPHVDVARFDILPTRLPAPPGAATKEK